MSYTIKCDDGDLILGADGRYLMIEGAEKCAQDIAETLLNNYDPDFQTYYNGSQLYLVDQKPNLISTIGAESFIREAVDTAIDRLRDQQDLDAYVDDQELIDRVEQLTVMRIGPASYAFSLLVITTSEDEVPLESFEVTLRQQLPDSLQQGFGGFVPADQGEIPPTYL